MRITMLAAEKARVELLAGDGDSGESIIWAVIQEGVVKPWRKPWGLCANKQDRAAGYRRIIPSGNCVSQSRVHTRGVRKLDPGSHTSS